MIQVHRFKVRVQFSQGNPYRPQGPGNRDQIPLGSDKGVGNPGYRVLQFLVVHDNLHPRTLADILATSLPSKRQVMPAGNSVAPSVCDEIAFLRWHGKAKQ
jgi:hypothetical protein